MFKDRKNVAPWLFVVAGLGCFMLILGGLVRLTHSGLSMVEWRLITGTIPPVSDAGWADVFAKYQQTPEYRHLNAGMSLAEFKFIFWMEYAHRLLGRLTGLVYFIPFFIFWARGVIPRADLPRFFSIGALLMLQGLFGWYMVVSGLVDEPQVSHYRLTGHLLLALLFVGMCVWTGLAWQKGASRRQTPAIPASAYRTLLAFYVLLVVQIALGGMVAGLKAGLISNTFPGMAGAFFPAMAWSLEPWWKNLLENPFFLHFVHRWNGFLVLILGGVAWWQLRRLALTPILHKALLLLAAAMIVQVGLGLLTILLQVPVMLASLHQAVALLLFVTMLFLLHNLQREPAAISQLIA